MISGLTLTFSRANGAVALRLVFTRIAAKRASARRRATNASTASALPARNRFNPSPATSTLPSSCSASASALIRAASASGASTATK